MEQCEDCSLVRVAALGLHRLEHSYSQKSTIKAISLLLEHNEHDHHGSNDHDHAEVGWRHHCHLSQPKLSQLHPHLLHHYYHDYDSIVQH